MKNVQFNMKMTYYFLHEDYPHTWFCSRHSFRLLFPSSTHNLLGFVCLEWKNLDDYESTFPLGRSSFENLLGDSLCRIF